MSSISEILVQLDSDGTIIYLNNAWETITGYKVSDTLQRNWKDFFKDSSDQIANLLDTQLPVVDATIRIFTAAGKELWIGGSLSKQYAGDELMGYIGAFSDVTEKVSSERKLLLNLNMPRMGGIEFFKGDNTGSGTELPICICYDHFQ